MQQAEESVSKTYIMGSDGRCFKIEHEVIVRDFMHPIPLSNSEWNKMGPNHVRFGASVFLDGRSISAQSVVVVRVPGDNGELQNFWFARASVDAMSPHYSVRFGENYLWQIPFNHCVAIKQNLEASAANMQIPNDWVANGLITHMAPAYVRFEPEAHMDRGVTEMHALENWYDRVFFMSVKPGIAMHPLRNEGRPKQKSSLARPAQYIGSTFDVSAMPSDVADLITTLLVDHLIHSPYAADFSMLYKMRLVCKTFRSAVEREAVSFCRRTCEKLISAERSKQVEEMDDVRLQLLPLCIPVLQIFKDSYDPNWITYLRWRTGKREGSRPPTRAEESRKRKRIELKKMAESVGIDLDYDSDAGFSERAPVGTESRKNSIVFV